VEGIHVTPPPRQARGGAGIPEKGKFTLDKSGFL